MSNLHVKYLLAGGGAASSAAARAIRQYDLNGDILLIGQEIHRPYHRPALSKAFLRREIGKADLFTESADWFLANHMQLRTGRRVVHVDPARDCVNLDNGESISFDHLLIATGAGPAMLNMPGAQLPNLFYLRTIEDAEHLMTAADKALREGRTHAGGRGRVTVIGGGVLGVELAGSFAQLGLGVNLSVSGDYPWPVFAGETTGKLLVRYLELQGVSVHLNNRAVRLEGDGRVQRVMLADGTSIDCDFAVAAVGLTIHKEIIRNSHIVAEKAVLVDSHCRSSQPNVFAAGDCAAVLDPLFAKHRLMASHDDATITGSIAGANMAGGDVAFHHASHFQTQIFDLSADVWGEAKLVSRRIIRGSTNAENPDFLEIGIASDGRVAQVIAVGHSNENDLCEKMVLTRMQVNGNEENLRDPVVGLGEITHGSRGKG